jgi:CRISPR-associated protein Cas2
VIVVVLSVTPERLRGELTRWLLEINAGVYVEHLTTRVRERLWLRIVDDIGRGRALMVWSARTEQRLQFRVHNHAWAVEDFDGISLMRRVTAESQAMARRRKGNSAERPSVTLLDERPQQSATSTWSAAGRRRRFRNAVEQRRHGDDALGHEHRSEGS